MHVTAIIAAGGRGHRFGGGQPKQFVAFGEQSALERSVSAFTAHPAIDEIVVALPDDVPAGPLPYLQSHSKRIVVVPGGTTRQNSVTNAFQAASPESDMIVVHDAVRPFVSAALISRTIAAAAESGAAVAAIPVRDTVKRSESRVRPDRTGESSAGDETVLVVAETLPRASIFLAQTPQAFRREVLIDALALGVRDATDEASLAERAGHIVRIVEGDWRNIKITTPEDMILAESISRDDEGRLDAALQPTESDRRDATEPTGAPSMIRIGTGYDIHRLVEGRPLVLGGVRIPFERGLLGHSDADAVAHAVTDAVLGAAAVGDIGRMFPDSDPEWRGASSIDLLRRAMELVGDRRYAVVNVDVVVIAERPKIGPFIDSMRACLADALGIRTDAVSIKGKTNEGVDAVGRGEAIAVHAVALLQRNV